LKRSALPFCQEQWGRLGEVVRGAVQEGGAGRALFVGQGLGVGEAGVVRQCTSS